MTNEFESSTLTTTDDLKGAFSALESGQVQYVAADAIIGTYAAHSAGDEVHIVAFMQQPSGLSVGVLDGNTELKQAVSEALSSLTGNGMISVIEKKWLGTALDLSSVPLTEGATASKSSTSNTAGGDSSTQGDEVADDQQGEEGGEAPSAEGADAGEGPGANAVQPANLAA